MGMNQVITYYAARPFKAVHPPDDTGVMVEYQPGDVVPAGDWGAAANWLKEAGKIFPTAANVWVDDVASTPRGEQLRHRQVIGGEHPPSGPMSAEAALVDESAPYEDGVEYPLHEGAGWYRLSNGEKVRGKDDATAAQAALGDEDE